MDSDTKTLESALAQALRDCERDYGEQQGILEDAQREIDRLDDEIDALRDKDVLTKLRDFINHGDDQLRAQLLDAHRRRDWPEVIRLHFDWLTTTHQGEIDAIDAEEYVSNFLESL